MLAAILFLSEPAAAAPSLSAEKSILIDADTGRVICAHKADSRSLIASTTKIMTALLICERCDLDAEVNIPREAVGIEGSSMYLREGEILRVEDLLYGMMLHSGNDAAAALAIHCCASIDAFVAEMNRRWEAQRQSGIMDADSGAMMIATTHYDSQGNEISAQEASIHYVYDREGGVIAEYHQPYDVTGVRVQYAADDSIDITVNTAADIRMAEHERNLRVNLITMIFAIEPLLALLAYFILRPVKRKKNQKHCCALMLFWL